MSRLTNVKVKQFKKGVSTASSAKSLGKAIYNLSQANKYKAGKDKYYDFSDVITNYAKVGNNKQLAKIVQARSKQLNQRFYRLEKAGKGIDDTAYYFAKYETGKEKPRYTTNLKTLESMSTEELLEQGLQVSEKLRSKTSTLTGLLEVENNRIEASISSLNDTLGMEMNKEDFLEFINGGGYEMLNSKYLDSYQVIEDWLHWKEQGITDKQFINRYHQSLNAKRESTRESARTRAEKSFKRLTK